MPWETAPLLESLSGNVNIQCKLIDEWFDFSRLNAIYGLKSSQRNPLLQIKATRSPSRLRLTRFPLRNQFEGFFKKKNRNIERENVNHFGAQHFQFHSFPRYDELLARLAEYSSQPQSWHLVIVTRIVDWFGVGPGLCFFFFVFFFCFFVFLFFCFFVFFCFVFVWFFVWFLW